MRGSVVGQLILKDWRVFRGQLLFALVGGAFALTVVQWRREAPLLVGVICFFISLVVVGHTLPIFGIVNERKNQNLAFLMSLPVSSIQYTTGSTNRCSASMAEAISSAGSEPCGTSLRR